MGKYKIDIEWSIKAGINMNIWKCDRWKEIYHGYEIRSGLRLRFEEGVDIEVKNALKDFAKYFRKEYIFPIRVPIYVR